MRSTLIRELVAALAEAGPWPIVEGSEAVRLALVDRSRSGCGGCENWSKGSCKWVRTRSIAWRGVAVNKGSMRVRARVMSGQMCLGVGFVIEFVNLFLFKFVSTLK